MLSHQIDLPCLNLCHSPLCCSRRCYRYRLPCKSTSFTLAPSKELTDSQLPINFVLPAIEPLLAVASLQPMPLLYKEVTGSAGAALGLLCLSKQSLLCWKSHDLIKYVSSRHLGLCCHWFIDCRLSLHMGLFQRWRYPCFWVVEKG